MTPRSPQASGRLDTLRHRLELALSAAGSDLIALSLSVIWIVFVLLLLFVLADTPPQGDDALTSVMSFVSIFLPLVLIWIAAAGARTTRHLRAEAARLRAELEAMGGRPHQPGPPPRDDAALERKIEQLARAQKATDAALATFHTTRQDSVSNTEKFAQAAARPVAPVEKQPSLALQTPPQPAHSPISVADFITAIDFPTDENDREGFRALRLALADRNISRLVRAAEDLLTLLSHDGIYMDDLDPDRARAEIWRRFARGDRGRAVAALAGVRDRSCLALTGARMKADPVFRDAAHHFLRQFDKTFAEFEKNASDQDIAELAETRTARAFMLVGRVAGTFD